MELDHVLIAVPDLAAAAREFEARHGLASVEGGRHPGWGTANRIVPLGETYVELIAVVDADEAARSSFGSWVAGVGAGSPRPLGWAVRTDDLDAVAAARGLAVAEGSRATPTGEELRWRMAGIDAAVAEPGLPFFLQWAPGTPFPGRGPATGGATGVRISDLLVAGDPARLAAWLGSHDLPLTVKAGAPALRRVTLAGEPGEVVIAAD